MDVKEDNLPAKLFIPSSEGQLSLMLTKGGRRTGAGRKRIGITKKVSLTLSEETWEQIEETINAAESTKSEFIRALIEQYFNTDAAAAER
ncbi:MAG: hypothetical protein K0R67_1894 [Paenibacillus sp.]|jgi:hypothetical protein|nr:hypothetical protein [Paenibacillus sp.]